MSDLLAARSQMAMSLGFHILFAAVGIGMPLLMVIAEGLYLRTKDPVYLLLAKKWSKGTAVLFAIGAVSGTVLSFELGLLWPKFMAQYGSVIGMPFSMEGFAFFLEAIFLGIYMYGWKRVPAIVHLLSGVAVLFSGIFSGLFVICANGFMNTPAGFRIEDGKIVDIDPWAAMFNPAALAEGLHMTTAAFLSVAFLVAGIHAFMLLKDSKNPFHRAALGIALAVAAPMSVLQGATGHMAGETVGETQPVKLAAMEAHWETERWAPFRIGGWPDVERQETRYAIEIPGLMSFLSYGDPNAEVKGLKDFPKELHPPVPVVHVSFQIMIGAGVFMMAVAGMGVALGLWKRKLPDSPWFLKAVILASPMGMIAIEAGWVVTEVGRQPWIIQGVLKTADAVTPMPGLWAPFLAFSLLYLFLGATVVVLMINLVKHSPTFDENEA